MVKINLSFYLEKKYIDAIDKEAKKQKRTRNFIATEIFEKYFFGKRGEYEI